jgi:mRNA-degrading endonuclease RelE of RelBE toxin-antitoxin system
MHGDAIAMKGRPRRFRSRCGDYRIIYVFDTKALTI